MVGLTLSLLPVAVAGTALDAIKGDTKDAKAGLELVTMLAADIALQALQSGRLRDLADDVQRSVEDGIPIPATIALGCAARGVREAVQGLELVTMLAADIALQVVQNGGPRGVASRIANDVQRSVEDRVPFIPAMISLGCAAKGVREAVQGNFVHAGYLAVISIAFSLETVAYPFRSRT